MTEEPRYSILENNRFSREKSYDEKRLLELFLRGELSRDTELWSWDADNPRLAGTLESVVIRKRRFKERRIGLFGTAGCGKASFLACCTGHGKPFDDGSVIVFHGEGGKSGDEISVVDFSLIRDGAAWEIRTVDAFNGREPSGPLELWLNECDALLMIVDGEAFFDAAEGDTARLEEQVGALRQFLDRLRRKSSNGNRIEKPIAVVVSKADLVGYPDVSHPISQKLLSVLREFSDRVACFSVSVLDGARDAPYRVAEPWCWAVREVDRIRIESTPRTLSAFRELRDLWGINSGEAGREVETEISRLERLQRKRRRKRRLFVGLLILLVLGGVAWIAMNSLEKRDFLQFQEAKAAIRSARFREDVESALKQYRKSRLLPTKFVAELESLAGEKIAELGIGRAEIVFRTTRYTIVHAETPKKIDDALESFRIETVGYGDNYVEELEGLATKRRRELRFRFAWEKWKYDLEQAENFGRSKRVHDVFLENFTEDEYPEFADRIQEVRASLDQLILAEREGIQFLPPTAFYEKIVRIDEQIKAFGAGDPRRKPLEEDRKKIVEQWETTDYQAFRRIAVTARSADDLRLADEQAEHYFQQSARRTALRIPSRFENEVKAWKTWFDGLKEKHIVELSVTAILIPRSFFEARERGSKIVFTLKAGPTVVEYTVVGPDLSDENPMRFEPNLRCRVENAVWDENKGTEISLIIAEPPEGWRSWVFSGRKVLHKTGASEYPYIEFCPRPEGKFSFSVDENTVVEVETDPRATAMPELPL